MIARTLRVAADAAERAVLILSELSPAGFEERESEGCADFVVYGTADDLPEHSALRRALGPSLLWIQDAEIPDDWSERWKTWHQPVWVEVDGRRALVRPPWEQPAADADTLELVIDPGQAFGTGGHDTTRLCLELLLGRPAGGSLADWGCGTGVLALAAARLGWTPVTAIDFDSAAVEATKTNAEANGIGGLTIERLDLTVQPGPLADLVVANLILPLLLQVAAGMRQAPPVLIASGLLRQQVDEACAAFAPLGLRETTRSESREWAAVVLEKRS